MAATRNAIVLMGIFGHSLIRSTLSFSIVDRIARIRLPQKFRDKLSGPRWQSAPSVDEIPKRKAPAKFVSFPFEYRQEIELEIETLTNRGWGLARYALPADNEHDASKWVVMVPNVIPGERVKVAVFRNMKNYSEADLVELIAPSPDRVSPLCTLAEACGGCQLQHISIDAQRKWKTEFVQDGLRQYNIDFKVSPTIGTDEIYGYRSKLTPHFNAPHKKRRRRPNDPPIEPKFIEAIGFQSMTSRSIIDVEQCPIATNEINEKYAELRVELLAEPTDRRKGATLLLRQGNVGDKHVETKNQEYLTTTVKGLDFTYQAGNFFQNNNYVLPLMVEHVRDQSIRDGGMTHLVDCYCGSGLFAVSVADFFTSVVGIEINDKAVEEATQNALRNSKPNCEFIAASSEGIFHNIQSFPRDTTVVVLDPPRKGCSPEFLEQLYKFAPTRIVYMSCDPITQARDAEGIVKAGYSITSIQPFDLFPQTRHIECLMILDRKR